MLRAQRKAVHCDRSMPLDRTLIVPSNLATANWNRPQNFCEHSAPATATLCLEGRWSASSDRSQLRDLAAMFRDLGHRLGHRNAPLLPRVASPSDRGHRRAKPTVAAILQLDVSVSCWIVHGPETVGRLLLSANNAFGGRTCEAHGRRVLRCFSEEHR